MEEKASPKTSIIITTYNRSQILAKRSLPSCLEQTYPNFECIVVDDCSTDNTQKVVEGFKNREGKIKYYKLSKNSGVSAARNYGVKKARGEFIAFLDDGCKGKNCIHNRFLFIAYNSFSVQPDFE